MNNKYKNLLYLLSLAIMTAVFSGCDRSDDVKPATAQVIRANVTAEDIPEVTSSLLNQLGLRKGGQGFSVYTEGQELGIEIDWNRIKQLIDTTGKQTYTLAVKDKDNDPKTFYNLIFQLTPDNEPYKPYLLKYSMDDDFAAAYYSGEANFGNFKGTVQKIILHNIANRSSTENIFSDDGEKTVAADDCPNTTQFNGSNGGGNSGGGSNTGTLPDDEAQWQCEVFIQETDWYDCLTPDCSVKVYDETTYVITYENCQLVSAMSTPTDDDSCKQKDDELPIIEPLSNPKHAGDKPLKEYKSKCEGIMDIFDSYPDKETAGYITMDGKFIFTNIIGAYGGEIFSTYEYAGSTYYPFPKSQGSTQLTYEGMIENNNYYFIPVVASVHTHSPCRIDNTDGVSGFNVSAEDKSRAQASPNIKHWVVGCGAIGQYIDSSNSYFNISKGNLSAICKRIE